MKYVSHSCYLPTIAVMYIEDLSLYEDYDLKIHIWVKNEINANKMIQLTISISCQERIFLIFSYQYCNLLT